ncbi:hypothetical protein [uncultured Acetobacteroides sp.]|uniref:hypothetical protein n=1 Tax=uncultured Acetobacteroides sp. TaxID=1760811 RepID=UPI0029F5897F|nr:hypothetical protein [uncultured Acetobacteroides sp.]
MPKDRKAKAKKEQQKKQKALLQQKEYHRRRDEYNSNITELAKRLDLEEWISSFDPYEMLTCYKMRITSFVYRPVGASKLPQDLESFARRIFSSTIRNKQFTYPSGAKVSGHEVLHLLEKIAVASLTKMEEAPELYARLREKVDTFVAFMESSLQEIESDLSYHKQMIGWISSTPDKVLYVFSLNVESSNSNKNKTINESWTSKYCVSYEAVPVPSRTFTVEGSRRIGFRYGFPLNDDRENLWLTLPARLFGITEQEMLEVYIQTHALNRIVERIDTILFGMAFAICTLELKAKPNVRKVGSNSFLIDVVVCNLKLGYFVACIIDGVVLIKTFLFVTSSSTPEGNKLDTLTGLKKMDKQFLGIDKLSTYLALDVNKSPELVASFQEAGLQELLLIDKDVFSTLSKLIPEINLTENSALIASYIERRATELSLSQVEVEEGEIALR